jgi:hypothetical protein
MGIQSTVVFKKLSLRYKQSTEKVYIHKGLSVLDKQMAQSTVSMVQSAATPQ